MPVCRQRGRGDGGGFVVTVGSAVWCCRGRPGVWVGVALPELRNKEKSPIGRRLQGVGGSVGVVGGWGGRRFGCLGVSWTWRVLCSVFCCQRTRELKKNPVNVGLQGLWLPPGIRVFI